MIIVNNTILSDDFKENHFVCDLMKCKGACCVEGDVGAPVESGELATLDSIYPEVAPYLSKAGRKVIEKEGKYVEDFEGEYVTPTQNGNKECAYAIYDENKILKCGIEQAYNDGKINFRKPVSCHLYPARITQYEQYDAVNYDRWHICDPACELGDQLQVPLYKFLKNALIRKYGDDWYQKLEAQIKDQENITSGQDYDKPDNE